MLVHGEVRLIGHHVEESAWRRVLDDDDGVPPRLFALADDDARRFTCIPDGSADTFEMRGDFLDVPDIALPSFVAAELQQVDHHHGFVRRTRCERGDLLLRRFQRRTHPTQPLTLMRRPAFTQTLTLGAGGGGGGAYSASFSSENGSAHPLTSTNLPPTEPHTVACAVGAGGSIRPVADATAAANNQTTR